MLEKNTFLLNKFFKHKEKVLLKDTKIWRVLERIILNVLSLLFLEPKK